MVTRLFSFLAFIALVALSFPAAHAACTAPLLDVQFRPLAGKTSVNLCDRFHGQVLLVVNTATYGVQFPMFEKVSVKEGEAVPFYRALAEQAGGRYPGWNFHKYLISREGIVVANFGSRTTPDDKKLLEAIETELAKSVPES